MKKLLSLFLSLALLMMCIPAMPAFATETQLAAESIVAQGDCGKNISWTLDSDGLLTITGEGKMTDFIYSGGETIYNKYAPWRKGDDWYKLVKKIVIEPGVTYIGKYAFCELPNLTTVSIPDTVRTFGQGAFTGNKSLSSVNIPNGATNISKSMFSGCTSLKSIDIPASVNQIGEAAFKHCAITSIVLPEGLTIINGSTFQYSSLTSIVIPEGVTRISSNAFECCFNLKSVVLPNSLSQIKPNAFRQTAVTKVFIPKNVTEIGNDAFGFCDRLSTVYFTGNAPDFHPYVFEGTTAKVYYPKDDATWTESVRKDYYGDLTWIAYTPLDILKQPASVYAMPGTNASVTVAAAGEELSYLWYFRDADATTFEKSNLTQSTYSCTMEADVAGRQVYCVITDRFGNSVKTETVTLYMETEHAFGPWEETKAPTCTENGSEDRECANCGHIETREKEAKGHTCEFDLVTEPTKTTVGKLTGICENCGDSCNVELPRLNKRDYTYSVLVEPAEETAGICRYTWKVSDYGDFYFDVTLDKFSTIAGDLDENEIVDDEDVIYLLWHTLMPTDYEVNQNVDFDHNGIVDDEDVIYLLWHTLMPDDYPL